jgi:hypothetical protein
VSKPHDQNSFRPESQTLDQMLEQMKHSGFITKELLADLRSGPDLKGKIGRETYIAMLRAFGGAVSGGREALINFSQKSEELHRENAKQALSKPDVRVLALKEFKKLYEDRGQAYNNMSLKRFHHHIFSLFGSTKTHKARDLQILIDFAENPQSRTGRVGNQHALNLFDAMESYRSWAKPEKGVNVDAVYKYISSQVSLAQIHTKRREDLIGHYYCFRMAYLDPGEVNVSHIEITATKQGALTYQGRRSDAAGTKVYNTSGMVFRVGPSTIKLLGIGRRSNNKEGGLGREKHEFLENALFKFAWSGRGEPTQLFNGIYNGMSGTKQRPFSTRLLLVKELDNAKGRGDKVGYREVKGALPLACFSGETPREDLSEDQKSSFEYFKGLESAILMPSGIDLAGVAAQITNKLDEEFFALLEYDGQEKSAGEF